MAPNDIKKIAIITKLSLYAWNVMPFKMKNATNTFSQTTIEVFKNWNNQFLKVFVDDVNVDNMNWTTTCSNGAPEIERGSFKA
jgi:hypothetical protein